MQQPHQHGPGCRHGPGGHGGHGGHGHGHGGHGQNSISPKEYFEKMSEMKSKNPEFYWMQILTGNMFSKYCQEKGLDFLKAISCQVVTMVVAQAEMMFTCQWLPLWSRAFVSGLFFPLCFLLVFNFNVIYGVAGLEFTAVHLFSYLTILFYALTALRSPGAVNVQQATFKTKEAIRQRPYLESPMLSCPQCKVLRLFRAFHCPMCKVCITKFTRHSLAFGSCIGSTNELLAWAFFLCITVAEFLTICAFFNESSYGLITNIMFYVLNVYILWISFVEVCTIFVMNFWFGVTEHECRMWMMCQYLMKVPEREFVNSVGKGLCNNIIESFYALFSISGYESKVKVTLDNPMQEEIPISGQSNFQKLEPGKTYLINWNKAFYYLIPQIPSHPCRDNVVEMMKRDEPRMVEMFKLQQKFKEEILKETEGQGLNDFQIQQRVGMKMQQHMMRNAQQNMIPQQHMMRNPQQQQMMTPPQQMMSAPQQQQPPQQHSGFQPPSPQQQKMIQIQMITHMISQLQQKEPETTSKLNELLTGLKNDTVTPMEVGIAMRQIQQEMMKKQMEAVMRQREEMERKKQEEEQLRRKDEDEEEQLKKQEVADEDL